MEAIKLAVFEMRKGGDDDLNYSSRKGGDDDLNYSSDDNDNDNDNENDNYNPTSSHYYDQYIQYQKQQQTSTNNQRKIFSLSAVAESMMRAVFKKLERTQVNSENTGKISADRLIIALRSDKRLVSLMGQEIGENEFGVVLLSLSKLKSVTWGEFFICFLPKVRAERSEPATLYTSCD